MFRSNVVYRTFRTIRLSLESFKNAWTKYSGSGTSAQTLFKTATVSLCELLEQINICYESDL